jgi:hypothetical protein
VLTCNIDYFLASSICFYCLQATELNKNDLSLFWHTLVFHTYTTIIATAIETANPLGEVSCMDSNLMVPSLPIIFHN